MTRGGRPTRRSDMTSPTRALHELGQSLWLDNITRGMLDDGTIKRYIEEYSVTGLTSNPSIFDKAVEGGGYDEAIATKSAEGTSGEELFFELAIEDLRRAADLFAPVHAGDRGSRRLRVARGITRTRL